jgi:hypothetical protein
MEEMRIAYKILLGHPERKRPLVNGKTILKYIFNRV